MGVCGQIIAGQVGKILIREKSGEKIQLGDLLVSESSEGIMILQVTELIYGSQVSQLAREMIAGMKLEGMVYKPPPKAPQANKAPRGNKPPRAKKAPRARKK